MDASHASTCAGVHAAGSSSQSALFAALSASFAKMASRRCACMHHVLYCTSSAGITRQAASALFPGSDSLRPSETAATSQACRRSAVPAPWTRACASLPTYTYTVLLVSAPLVESTVAATCAVPWSRPVHNVYQCNIHVEGIISVGMHSTIPSEYKVTHA